MSDEVAAGRIVVCKLSCQIELRVSGTGDFECDGSNVSASAEWRCVSYRCGHKRVLADVLGSIIFHDIYVGVGRDFMENAVGVGFHAQTQVCV